MRQSAPLEVPFYKRTWILISGTTAVVSALLLNAPQMLQNARVLPKEIQETVTQFISWVKEDSEWTGHWSAFPEGVVDMADMHLSDVDMQITIWASQGKIDGTIATKEICKTLPIFNYVLLRGEVYGNTAIVTAWDIVQGHKTDFAILELVREGEIVTVTPIAGLIKWFPSVARLARHPSLSTDQIEPDSNFCSQEMESFIKKPNAYGEADDQKALEVVP